MSEFDNQEHEELFPRTYHQVETNEGYKEFETYVGNNFELCLEFGALASKHKDWFYNRRAVVRVYENIKPKTLTDQLIEIVS